MVEELFQRLTESQLMAKTVTVEVKSVKFETKQHASTVKNYIYQRKDLLSVVMKLLKELWPIT